jgi:hypothetical protein
MLNCTIYYSMHMLYLLNQYDEKDELVPVITNCKKRRRKF